MFDAHKRRAPKPVPYRSGLTDGRHEKRHSSTGREAQTGVLFTISVFTTPRIPAPYSERTRFPLRGEFFHGLNQTHLGTPGRFVNTTQFATIPETTAPGREIQLSASLSFSG